MLKIHIWCTELRVVVHNDRSTGHMLGWGQSIALTRTGTVLIIL